MEESGAVAQLHGEARAADIVLRATRAVRHPTRLHPTTHISETKKRRKKKTKRRRRKRKVRTMEEEEEEEYIEEDEEDEEEAEDGEEEDEVEANCVRRARGGRKMARSCSKRC